MNIKVKHHIILYPFFKWLARFLIKRNFFSVQIDLENKPTNNAILLLANHISWWDGFWIEYLNQKMNNHKFCFMMLDEQLKKHWYFKYVGGFSVKKKSRTIIDSIDYSVKLLSNEKNMVLIFPQGKIHSLYRFFISFEQGTQKIVQKLPNHTQVLFVVNMIDYFSNARPTLFVYGKLVKAFDLKNGNVEQAYNFFYQNILEKHNLKTS